MKGTLYGLVKTKNDIQVKSQWEKMMKEVDSTGAFVINGADIAAGTIYGRTIVAGSITADEIKSGSITSDLITAQGIVADKIKSGILQSINPLNKGGSMINMDTGHFSFAGGSISYDGSGVSITANSIKIGSTTVATEEQVNAIKKNYTWVAYADTAAGDGISKTPTGKTHIGFAYNKDVAVPPTLVASNYAWQKVTGDSTQVHFAYATNETGEGFSTKVHTGKTYIGTYTDFTEKDSQDYRKYKWTKIKGEVGPKGETGIGIQGPPGENGEKTYVWMKYATTPTSGMSDLPAGKDYIGFAYNKITPTESSTYSHYSWSLIKGDVGIQGPIGPNGQATFTWFKYSDTVEGEGMSDDPAGKRFVGIAPNKTTAIKGTIPKDYTWSAMYDLEILDDISLKDKTEILSGIEIYTDKADDANVHVEIDGKSYQNAGSGSNLAIPEKFIAVGTSASLDYDPETNIHTVNYSGTSNSFNGFASRYITVKAKQRLNISFEAMPNQDTSLRIDYNNESVGIVGNDNRTENGHTTFSLKQNKWSAIEGYYISDDKAEEFTDKTVFYVAEVIDGLRIQIKNIQYTIGSDFLTYEPPAPTPDYPIPIESLNNFDIVSSVGEENLLKNTSGEWNTLNLKTTDYYAQFGSDVKMEVGETYTFSIQVEKISSDSNAIGLYFGSGQSGKFQKDSFATANVYHMKTDGTTVSRSFTVKEEDLVNATGTKFEYFAWRLRNDLKETTIRFRNAKLEKGSTATPYSRATSDIQYNTQTPTLYKTNILLSEPLRSVGDVKDRIYRDNDGLWKIERNVGERVFDGSEYFTNISVINTPGYLNVSISSRAVYNAKMSSGLILSNKLKYGSRSLDGVGYGEGIISDISSSLWYVSIKDVYSKAIGTDVEVVKDLLRRWKLEGSPLDIQYILDVPFVETLSQDLQSKLNNIASFKGDNYVYTVLDKSDILSPELHATFKSKAWYSNFKMNDGIVASQAEKFKNVEQEKKTLDERYKKLYAHVKLSGGVKTALYNAKIAYNTKFTALETSLAYFLLEKTEQRLSDLENSYSGTNGYVSVKSSLEVALDDAQTNITEGIADDKTGRNLWIANKYTNTFGKVEPTIELIRGLAPVESIYMDDGLRFSFNSDNYIGHYFTYVYVESPKTISTTFAHDDGGSVYINGKKIYGTSATLGSGQPISIPLNKGWNQVDLMNLEVIGSDFATLGHKLSSLVDDMSCYLGGGLSMSQIRQLNDEIDIRVQEGKIITAINLSKEGVKIDGKMLTVTGQTTFEDTVTMNAGRIQSKNSQSYLDLNNNQFRFGDAKNHMDWSGGKLDIVASSVRFGSSNESVASVKDIEGSISQIEVGGRNLIKYSDFSKTLQDTAIESRNIAVHTLSIDSSVKFENTNTLKINVLRASSAVAGADILVQSTVPTAIGSIGDRPTIFSFYAKSTNSSKLNARHGYSSYNNPDAVQLTTDWKKYSITLKQNVDSGGDVIFQMDKIDTVYLAKIKLEKGNRATDWTQAPEDVEESYSAVALAKANLAETQAKAHADGKVSAEEKRAIAEASAKLTEAKNHANSVSSSAETRAKSHADAVAIAKANLAETQAKAHADGKVSAEEKRAIAEAKDRLAEAKRYADEQDDLIEIGGRNYLLDSKTLPVSTPHEIVSHLGVDGVVKITSPASATYINPIELYSDEMNKSEEHIISVMFTYKGIKGVHPQIYTGAYTDVEGKIEEGKFNRIYIKAKPAQRIHLNLSGYTEVYMTRWKVEKGNKATDWSPAPEDVEKAYNAVAVAKANLAETQAKAHADGKVTAEENRAIAEAKAKLTEAKNHANSVSSSAETRAKSHADAVAVAKANLAETQAKAHADGKVSAEEKRAIQEAKDKLAEAKKYAEDYTLSDKKIKDTRTVNSPPSWYYSTYPDQIVREFKNTSTMGIGAPEGTYGILTTDVPWSSSSGGAVKQSFVVLTRTYRRQGTVTDWSSWVGDVTKQDFRTTGEVEINGGNLTVGVIKDKYNRSSINLDNGTFSFGSGKLVYDGTDMSISGKLVNKIRRVNKPIPGWSQTGDLTIDDTIELSLTNKKANSKDAEYITMSITPEIITSQTRKDGDSLGKVYSISSSRGLYISDGIRDVALNQQGLWFGFGGTSGTTSNLDRVLEPEVTSQGAVTSMKFNKDVNFHQTKHTGSIVLSNNTSIVTLKTDGAGTRSLLRGTDNNLHINPDEHGDMVVGSAVIFKRPAYKNTKLAYTNYNATANSNNAWNRDENSAFKVQSYNNAMAFLVGGTQNDRNAVIQVGHAELNYANILGNLHLNRLGGTVFVGAGLSVSGAKNAIHVTRDGVRGTPAYETAESYLGDIGEDKTNQVGKKKIYLETLFHDTVNTTIPYQVFLQSYGNSIVWVSERNSEYFIVESSVPLIKFAWEIKAKRRGYENDRMVLQDISNEDLKSIGAFTNDKEKEEDGSIWTTSPSKEKVESI